MTLTVVVGLVSSGMSSTCSPLGKRYSVMPSTLVTFCSAALWTTARDGLAEAGAACTAAHPSGSDGKGQQSEGQTAWLGHEISQREQGIGRMPVV